MEATAMRTAVAILSESPLYWTFSLAERLAMVKEWRQERDVTLSRSRVINWLRTGNF
jgi:hypothetical protein